MPRTTSSLVSEIIEVDGSISLVPFIAAAGVLVDLVAEESEHTDSTLTLIETWLAAHFYTIRDPRPTMERAGSIAIQYQSAVTFNLYTSHYGQMAMVLDTTGTLRRLSSGKKVASVSWAGLTDEERELLDS